MTVKQRFAMVPIEQLIVGDNVRHTVGDVDDLAASIKAQGILEPIVACPSADSTHVEVLMGQRRFAAAQQAGLTEVPCLLRPRPDDRDRVLMQLAENLEREPMSPIDEALAFQELVELGISRRAIAGYVKRSESAVGKQIKLLDLPDVVRVALDAGWITVTVAQEIPSPLYTDAEALKRLAPTLAAGGDTAVRTWIRSEAALRSANPRGKVVLKGVRVVNVTMEAYELAVAEAKAAGLGLGEWTTAAVFAYAREREEDAA